jgi:hypothetical protein
MIPLTRNVLPVDAPLMVHFSGKPGSRPRGLNGWGGRVLHLDELAAHDLALQLGAPRPWVESLIRAILDSGARRIVLINPDFRLFMGDADGNRERFRQAMADARLQLTELPFRDRARTPLLRTA